MPPFIHPLFARAPLAATLVALTVGADNGSPLTPVLADLGVKAGDMGVFFGSFSGTPTSAGGAWNAIVVEPGTDAQKLWWRIFNAADVAGRVSTSRGFSLLIFRGASRLMPRPMTGFVKMFDHAGLVSATYSYGSGNDDRITSPAGFFTTNRLLWTGSGGIFNRSLMQWRTGAVTSYVDGASFVVSANLSSATIICELRA